MGLLNSFKKEKKRKETALVFSGDTDNLPVKNNKKAFNIFKGLKEKTIDKSTVFKPDFYVGLGKLCIGKMSFPTFAVKYFPKVVGRFIKRTLSGAGKLLQQVFPVMNEKPAKLKITVIDEYTMIVECDKDPKYANIQAEILKFFPDAFDLNPETQQDKPILDVELAVGKSGELDIRLNDISFNAQDVILEKMAEKDFGKEFEEAERNFEKEVEPLLPPETLLLN